MAQDTKKDDGISSEISEIGCMCTKCNCNRMVPLVVSICDSCLKGKHTSKVVYTIKVEREWSDGRQGRRMENRKLGSYPEIL